MPLGGGVQEQVIALAIGTERAQVGSIPAKRARQVVQEGAGCRDTCRNIGHAKAIEGVNLEVRQEQLRGGHRVKEVPLDLLDRGEPERKAVREIAEDLFFAFGNEDLRGSDPDHFVEQRLGGGEFCDAELTGAQVGAGEAEGLPFLRRRQHRHREVVVFLLQSRILERPGAQDPGDLAAHKFASLDLPHLLAESDPLSGGQQLLHVPAGCVVGDTAHRHLPPLGERHVQDRRGLAGVVKEHLVEIAEPEEEEGPRRQISPKCVILLHHGSSLGGHKKGC